MYKTILLGISTISILAWTTRYESKILAFSCMIIIQVLYFFINRRRKGSRLPSSPCHISLLQTDWLTNVLRLNKMIGEKTEVASFNYTPLPGGCHYQVSLLTLTYRNFGTAEPKLLVIKLLCWHKTLLERIKLYTLKSLHMYRDKMTMYLRSYEIEVRFYQKLASKMKGLKVPTPYYTYEDVFNNQFGLLMEPIVLSEVEEGTNGFSHKETILILEQLAKFHCTFWNDPQVSKKMEVWDLGGYWTGEKRREHKLRILSDYKKARVNFETYVDFGRDDDLAQRLQNNLHDIFKKFDAIPKRTLIHGDFKVTNLFVEKNTRDVWAIDWQWLGKGSGIIDVVYFLCTSTDIKILEKETIEELLKNHYYKTLIEHEVVTDYSFDELKDEFYLSFFDFFIYCVTVKWAYMTPVEMMDNMEKKKDGLHLRSFRHVEKLIDLTLNYMNELDLR